MRLKREDVPPIELDKLSWTKEHAPQSLNAIHKAVSKRSNDLYDSYNLAIKSKRRWAKILRTLTIILSTAAGIWLLLSSAYYNDSKHLYWSPIWSAIILATAAALVLLDHFYGFSTSWIRYSRVSRELVTYIDTWQGEWQLLSSSWHDPPNSHQIAQAIGSAIAISKTIDKVLIEENKEWMADMQKALKEIEDSLDKQRTQYEDKMKELKDEAKAAGTH